MASGAATMAMDPARTRGPGADAPGTDALLEQAILGGGLPPGALHHLREAGRCYHEDARAESHLRAAMSLAPDHAAVLIALYRFFFYKNRLPEALRIARQCLDKAADDSRLDREWRRVGPADACFDDYEAVLPRFYLFTLKGYAYLNLRLGNIDEGREAVAKLMELDPADRLGGRVLLGVLARMGQSDDE